MSDELTEDQRQVKADAMRLLAEPATARAIAFMRAKFRHQLEMSAFDAKEEREYCYQMLQACKEFQHQLTSMATKGDYKEMRRERAQRAGGNAAT